MSSGKVKWFNPSKGFGFIQPNDGGNDVFVHITALEDAGIHDLHEGQDIHYDLVDNKGRAVAGNLKVLA